MGQFADTVDAWAKETEQRMTAVWRQSIDDLADTMNKTRANGGRLPHLTGNLMRSLLASTSAMPATGEPDAKYSGQDVGLVTSGLRLDQTVWLGYQAIYARRLNYGFVGKDKFVKKDGSVGREYNQAGAHFVEGAIADWPNIVRMAVSKIKAGAS